MNRFQCLQRKTLTDEQFRDSQIPMGNEVLMDSSPDRFQINNDGQSITKRDR